jgi:hypothetical protein
MVAPVRRCALKRLGHEGRDQIELTRHLSADRTISYQAVGISKDVIVHDVQCDLDRRVLVVALDHIQAHGPRVIVHRMITGDRVSNCSI